MTFEMNTDFSVGFMGFNENPSDSIASEKPKLPFSAAEDASAAKPRKSATAAVRSVFMKAAFGLIVGKSLRIQAPRH